MQTIIGKYTAKNQVPKMIASNINLAIQTYDYKSIYTGAYTDANNDGPKGDEYGNNKYSTLLLNYVDKNTLNESGIDLSYNEVHLSTGWLQGTDANTQAKKADWTSTGTNTRYFYSDGMINNQYGSQVRAQFHLGSGRFTQIDGLDRTYDANGAHATGTN